MMPHTTEPSRKGCQRLDSSWLIHSQVRWSGRVRGGTCINQAPSL
ncbi:Uncharacterised protein [Klebsiella pneumoniae]|nr:hypothetical protein OU9_03039 [Pseudomonas aeruginosa PAO1H2O]SVJ68471.1 Uncharacterised protein [Klebsiella pneumoniae]